MHIKKWAKWLLFAGIGTVAAVIGVAIEKKIESIPHYPTFAEAVKVNGDCGTSVQWDFDSDTGILNITGSGAMTTYSSGSAPWYQYRGYITDIVVSDEVTSISQNAFYECIKLQNLTVPFVGGSRLPTSSGSYWYGGILGWLFGSTSYTGGSQTYQYAYAYTLTSGAWSLDTSTSPKYSAYYIPSSLAKVTVTDASMIGGGAFMNCTGLSEVNLNDSIVSIDERAFYTCSSLKKFIFPSQVSNIPYYAFYGCSGLSEVDFADSVSSIGSHAFEGCSSLKELNFPSALSSIGDYAFANDAGLSALSFNSGLKTIGSYSFAGCSGVSSVSLPDGLATIGTSAFQGLSKPASLTVPDSVTSIGASAFAGWSSLKELTVPFVGGSRLPTSSGSYWYGGILGWLFGSTSYTGGSQTYQYAYAYTLTSGAWSLDTSTSPKYSAYYIPSSLAKVTVTDASMIGGGAFMNCTGLSEVNLNDSIVSIDERAFYTCSSLTYFHLPTSLQNIGDYSFYNCSSIEKLAIPSNVKAIGQYAFYGCSGLSEVDFADSVSSIGSHAFEGCSSLKELNFPSALSSIGDYAFANDAGLSALSFNSGLKTIGSYSFAGCSGVSSVSLPDGLATIGTSAFQGLSKPASLTVPDSVTSIGASAFAGWSSLKELTVPFVGGSRLPTSSGSYWYGGILGWLFGSTSYTGGSQTYQYAYAYTLTSGAWSLDTSTSPKYSAYYIPSSLAKVTVTDASMIGGGAFMNCTGIKNLSLECSINTADDAAFLNFGMVLSSTTDLVMTGGVLLAYIGKETTCSIPDGIRVIAARAFASGFDGTTAYWSPNTILTTVNFPKTVTNICDYAFMNCKNTVINVPKMSGTLNTQKDCFTNVKSVVYLDKQTYTNGNDTFYFSVANNEATIIGCSTTSTNMTLPTTLGGYTVVAVGFRGMADCTSLTSVTIPSNITLLDLYSFYGCAGLTTVTIPSTVSEVSDYAFANCSGLKTVTIAEGVAYVGDYCFYKCGSLTEIVVPDSCSYLGSHCFYECTSLASATIGVTVPAIQEYCFYGCEKLTTVVIGTSVASIGQYAFFGCALDRVSTPTSLTSIGDYAFASNSVLAKATLRTGLVTMGTGVFCDDILLSSITLPSSLEEMGAFCFYNCSSLPSITIPSLVSVVDDYSFARCTSLASATAEGTLTRIGDSAFANSGISTFAFKEGLLEIGRSAFEHTALSDATLPDSLTTIGAEAFANCESLATLSVPDSVTSVGTYAFFDNKNLAATIRYHSGTVAAYLFNNSSIVSVTMDDKITAIGDYAFAYSRYLSSVTFPNRLISIGASAFYKCDILAFVKVPDTLQSIGSNAFYKAPIGLDEFYGFKTITAEIYLVDGAVADGLFNGQHIYHIIVDDGIFDIGDSAFANCLNLVDVSLSDCVKTIGAGAFAADAGVTARIRYQDGIVDDKVFQNQNIYHLITDNGITSFGAYSFAGCVQLLTASVSNTLQTVGSHAFDGCKALTAISLPSTVKTIGSYAFYDCNSMASANVPDGVPGIEEYTFFGCSSLGKIELPATVKYIGQYAFYGCIAASSANIPSACTSIGAYAFYNCKSVLSLSIPDSVTSIGDYAFRSCVLLSEITIGDNVSSLGACVFYDCNGLKTVHLGKGVTELKDKLFYGCVNLTDLYVYAPLSSIDSLAFYGADDVTVHCGHDAYMEKFFTDNGIKYLIDASIIYDFTVEFVDEDGTVISTATYHYGDTVAAPSDPTKSADKTYTYSFSGWDSAVVACTGNATYTATYKATYIDYTVTFLNEDGTVVATVTYHYGDQIVGPADPTKASDNTYTYAFAGWDGALGTCTGNATYTATYSKTYIEYTVQFVDEDGTVISTATYHWGDSVAAPSDPTKSADKTYTYAFTGWDRSVVACSGNATYTATYSKTYIEYTVQFVDEDGTVISTATYHWGDSVAAPSDPTKSADKTYTYSFSGWDSAVVACTGNATYTATYKATYIDYTVTFLNEDGTVVATVTYHYGDQIVGPADPTKASDNTYTYAFAGWDGALGTCTGNATYTATYSKTYIEYTVQFVDEDGTVISTATYHWGDSVAAPSDPTKSADKTYTYAFTGWDRSVVACSGNATYTATYKATYIDYTVTFLNEDGTVVATVTYHYGDQIVGPADPTKASDNTYTYAFAGWDGALGTCTGNATYTATYKATYIDYTVTFLNEDGTVVATVTYHYGDQIVGPADPTKASDNTYTYAFAGWDGALGTCTGNATYTATYSKTYIEYTVQFVDEDGTVISTATYHWGDSVAAPSDPTKSADKTYTYAFTGWDRSVVACSGNATYTATYSKTYIEYTVQFVDEDGTVISTATYHWGDSVAAPSDPTKSADKTYTYSFSGWDSAVVACTGNATYTATYKATYIDYTVTFLNEDGTVVATVTYHYGDQIVGPADPTKASDNTYTYAFAGWDGALGTCTGNATYTATYSKTYIEYTVQFVDEDGTVISTATYHWGDSVAAPSDPTKSADKTYTYAFTGWDRSVVACSGNATYTATYSKTYIEYTVQFVDEDGTVISTATYHYGDTVAAPSDPTKSADKTYTYSFSGWDSAVVACTGNATYTATYKATYIDYTVTFLNEDGTVVATVTYHYGDQIVGPADPTKASDNTYTYAFAGWDGALGTCTGNATYTATYSKTYIEYTVQFVDEDGTVISTATYHWGDSVAAPSDPTKASDSMYDYTFAGWTPEVAACSGDATYKATYSKAYTQEYSSGLLRDQLLGDISKMTTIDLSTYDKIAAIEAQLGQLTAADKATVENALAPIIAGYNAFVAGINSEYQESVSITNDWLLRTGYEVTHNLLSPELIRKRKAC